MLEINNVTIEYNEGLLVKNFSFLMSYGERVVLKWETEEELDLFIKFLQGKLQVVSGVYKFQEQEVGGFSNTKAAAFRKTDLVYTQFNDPYYNDMSIERLLQLPLKYSGIYPTKWKRMIEKICDKLDLKDSKGEKVLQLPDRKQFSVYVAKAAVIEPKLILMRDPLLYYSGLELYEIQSILDILKATGIAICILSLNYNLAILADKYYSIENGSIFPEGLEDVL